MIPEGSKSIFLVGNWHCKAGAWAPPALSLHGSELFCSVTMISTCCVDGLPLLSPGDKERPSRSEEN